jgi:hypothetical protein
MVDIESINTVYDTVVGNVDRDMEAKSGRLN